MLPQRLSCSALAVAPTLLSPCWKNQWYLHGRSGQKTLNERRGCIFVVSTRGDVK